MIVALFPELLSFGGIQLAGRQIAATLKSIAEEPGSQFSALSLNDARGEHESSVGCLKFCFRGFERKKARFFLAALQAARARPRIILAAHPNLAPVAIAMKCLAGKLRIIVCTHGIEVRHPLSSVRRGALRNADLVLAPSADTARKLTEVQGIAKEKIRKLPWALDPDFLALASTQGSLSLPENFPSGLVVLTVGRWVVSERYKGAELLIQAVANLAIEFPNLYLVLAGSGDDVPRLKEHAKKSGCAERIYFLLNLSREALAACYAKADIFALPSSGEGFGFVFLEAMAMKKPVIGADLGGIPDIVQHRETGFLIDPRNPTSLTAALRELLTSRELRQVMGERGSEIAQSRFSFEGFQRELRSILCEENRN
jgi:phosphatidyl-myo-inositol dimannoside synthase